MKARILILGIGNAQVDLFEKCKAFGFYIVACSNTANGPALKLADVFELIDIADVDGVTALAQKHHVDFIYSIGSDIAMPTVCLVSQKLGLPSFVSPDVARICNAKPSLRAHLGESFRGNLKFQVFQNLSQINSEKFSLTFPLMMKPTDSQGQRGVRAVHSKEDIIQHFAHSQSFSKTQEVILETYVDGPEVAVYTYSSEGKVLFFTIFDKIAWNQFPAGLLKKHQIPSQFNQTLIEDNIRSLVENVLTKLGIHNGPTSFQIKINGTEPYLLEVSPRFGGSHRWRLVKYQTGIDLLDIALNHLTGSPPDLFTTKIQAQSAQKYVMEFMCEAPEKSMNQQQFNIDNPLFLHWYYQNGETIRSINGLHEKCGYYISVVE